MATAYVPRAVGIVASVLLGAGAVGPLVRTMLVEIQLDDVSTGRFHLLLGIAALSLLLSAVGRTGWLLLTGLGATGTLASLFIRREESVRIPVVSDLADQLTGTLGGLLTDFTKNVTSLEWGAGCLLGGILLLLGVGLTCRRY